MALQSHQERVIAECEGLEKRTTALANFCRSEKFREVDVVEQDRLMRQLSHMTEYLRVLTERVGAF
jgi:hypothetical protein